MKAVILCGGRGTRINEETSRIPKPMIKLGSKPILWHIMKIYHNYGFDEFILCLGYKGEIIESYDWSGEDWKIEFVDTGLETGTAGRLKKVKDLIEGGSFFLTYGDGLSDVKISSLLEFHNSHKKLATITAVRPLVRFGLLNLEGDNVKSFRKYSRPAKGWIDGGFFIFNREILDYLNESKNEDMLEGTVLEKLASENELVAFKHRGYWKCIDTYRDLLSVNKDITTGNDKWKVWE